jgi:hypothetical protein
MKRRPSERLRAGDLRRRGTNVLAEPLFEELERRSGSAGETLVVFALARS